MANEFKLDDVTADSDLSLMERKFERGSDIYTGLLDTALGAAQRWGEIQEQKNQAIKVEEEYRSQQIQSIQYDATDPASLAKAEARILRMGQEKIDGEKMPLYKSQWESAYNQIQREKNQNKRTNNLINDVYNPVIMSDDADGESIMSENYKAESFIEGGFYDSQGIKGQALIDKLDEGIKFYRDKSRSLETMKRLDSGTQEHINEEIDKLGFLKSFVAGGKTITDQEFAYAMQGQTLTSSYDRESENLDNKYMEIENIKDKMYRLTGGDDEGYLAIADENQIADYRELEADLLLAEQDLGKHQRTSNMLYDELNQSYVSNRVGRGDGSDELGWSSRNNAGGDDESTGPTQIGTVGIEKAKDLTSNTKVSFINSDGEQDEMRIYDLNKSVSKLVHIANKTPKSLHETTGNEDLIETYHMLKNIPEDSVLWNHKVQGKTLKKHFNNIKKVMDEKPANLPADDGKPAGNQMTPISVKDKDISKLSQDQRKEYYSSIESNYSQAYESTKGAWDIPYEFKVKSTKNGDFVDFTFGVGNFIDKANRDNRNIKVKYDNGKPYVTIESQWGNNDEHTIWLDDQTWKDMGFSSQGEYIKNAIQYKGDSKYLKDLGHKHMGD